MKKIISMIVAFSCMVCISNAQEYKTQVRDRILFGLKAGTNFSNVYDEKGEEFDAKSKTGLAAGAFVAIPIGEYLGIQPEILFSQKGFKAKGGILGSSYDFTRTTNYIDVPLLVAVKPVEFLTLVAGPQYSYLLKEKYDFENASTSIEQEEEFINDNIRKNTLSFTGGVDININHIVLGARAGWDFLNNNGDGTSTTPRYKNAWLQATVGYRVYYL
jgi:hypothetical protein